MLSTARKTRKTIPVFVPAIGVDTLKHLMDAFDVGWLGMGNTTLHFEEQLADYLGLDGRYVVCANTGTSAAHLALRAAGVGPGDEVITPSFNYVADHQAIRMCGADVVMCDVNEDDLGMDLASVESLITKRTKALVPLHFTGIPCRLEEVYALARRYGLRVVEDACHAFGSTVDGRKIGSFGDVQFFSFDPVKVITSIDGGCIVTPHESEFEAMRNMRLLGVDKDTTMRYKNARMWEYDVVSEGYRYHLTNIFASVGVSQLKRVDEFISNRQAICTRFSDAFDGIDGLRVLRRDYADVSPFIYVLRVLDGRRDALIAHLKSLDIEVGIHFGAAHRFTYFAGSRHSPMPVTDRVVEEVLTLPLHSLMPEEDIARVIDGVRSFFVGD